MSKKKLTIDDFTSTISPVEIDRVMGVRESKKFWKWMIGQTMSENGVYRWDLERYLQGLPVID
jgi:hypothetical protein